MSNIVTIILMFILFFLTITGLATSEYRITKKIDKLIEIIENIDEEGR